MMGRQKQPRHLYKLILAVFTTYVIAKEVNAMKIFDNSERWYVLRMTQEGALKWTTILNQRYANGHFALVTTQETYSDNVEEIRKRDVIFHLHTTPRDMKALEVLLKDFIVKYGELAKPVKAEVR